MNRKILVAVCLSFVGQAHCLFGASHLPIQIQTETDFNANVTDRVKTKWHDNGEHKDCDFYFTNKASCKVAFVGVADSLSFTLQKNPYYWDQTVLTSVVEVDAEGKETTIAALSPHQYVENEKVCVPLLPTTRAVKLAGNYCFFYRFQITERRDIRVADTAAIVDADAKGTVHPYTVTFAAANRTKVRVELSNSARAIFVLRAEGHADGSAIDFTSEDGLGADTCLELTFSVDLLPGASIEQARALKDGALSIVDMSTDAVPTHILPVRMSSPYHVRFLPASHGVYTVDFVNRTPAQVEEDTVDYVLYRTNPDSCTATLQVSAHEGYKFQGWFRTIEGGEAACIAIQPHYTGVFNQPMQVEARFVQDTVPVFMFLSDTTTLYTTLSEALLAASDSDVLVMVSSGVVAESCTIPSGITLYIPNDSTRMPMMDKPQVAYQASSAVFDTPTPFVQLTLAAGQTLVVEQDAAISLGGKQVVYSGGASQLSGSPQGPSGYIYLDEGSQLTIETGGTLYAWGFVYGPGQVYAREEAVIYEMMQLGSWKGGNISESITKKPYYIFPFNQYFVQNIESELVYDMFAIEHVALGLYANSAIQTTTADLVGYGALLEVNDGTMTRRYYPQQDSMVFEVNGFLYIGEIKVSSYKSSEYVLSLSSNMHFHVLQDGEIDVAYSMLLEPGGSMVVDEGALLLLGAEDNMKHCFFVCDYEDSWQGHDFATHGDRQTVGYSATLGRAPQLPQLRDAKLLINGTLEAYSLLYTTGNSDLTSGGADICSTGEGEILLHQLGRDSVAYQVSGTTMPPLRMEAETARLHNADKTYRATKGEKIEEDYLRYFYSGGQWWKEGEEPTSLTSEQSDYLVPRKVLIGERLYIQQGNHLSNLLGY